MMFSYNVKSLIQLKQMHQKALLQDWKNYTKILTRVRKG